MQKDEDTIKASIGEQHQRLDDVVHGRVVMTSLERGLASEDEVTGSLSSLRAGYARSLPGGGAARR